MIDGRPGVVYTCCRISRWGSACEGCCVRNQTLKTHAFPRIVYPFTLSQRVLWFSAKDGASAPAADTSPARSPSASAEEKATSDVAPEAVKEEAQTGVVAPVDAAAIEKAEEPEDRVLPAEAVKEAPIVSIAKERVIEAGERFRAFRAVGCGGFQGLSRCPLSQLQPMKYVLLQ